MVAASLAILVQTSQLEHATGKRSRRVTHRKTVVRSNPTASECATGEARASRAQSAAVSSSCHSENAAVDCPGTRPRGSAANGRDRIERARTLREASPSGDAAACAAVARQPEPEAVLLGSQRSAERLGAGCGEHRRAHDPLRLLQDHGRRRGSSSIRVTRRKRRFWRSWSIRISSSDSTINSRRHCRGWSSKRLSIRRSRPNWRISTGCSHFLRRLWARLRFRVRPRPSHETDRRQREGARRPRWRRRPNGGRGRGRSRCRVENAGAGGSQSRRDARSGAVHGRKRLFRAGSDRNGTSCGSEA